MRNNKRSAGPFDQNETRPRAGEVRDFPTGRALFFSAPPMPTGADAMDLNGHFLEINEVYLELGSSQRTGFDNQMIFQVPFSIGLMVGLVFPVFIAAFLQNERQSFSELFWIGFPGYATYGVMAWAGLSAINLVAFINRLRAASRDFPMRFNRQRREVCYVTEEGKPIIVPWEDVVAWGALSTGAGPYGAHTHANFGVGVQDPETGTVHNMLFGTYAMEDAQGMWEGIWDYMEYGPPRIVHGYGPYAKTSDPRSRRPYDSPETFDYEREQMHEEYRDGERGIFGVIFWYLSRALSFWKLPYKISAWEYHRARPPAIPEVEEWSQPLPEEQWAKRSEAQTQAVNTLIELSKRYPDKTYPELCEEALAGIPEYEKASSLDTP